MYDLTGKSVVYVGGFSGIGYQVCRMLMHKNIMHLVVCSRMEHVEKLKDLQAESHDVKVMFVQMNLMDHTNIKQAVQKVVGIVKHIDVLVNGAGILADKDVETTIGVNLTGLINTTLACLPYMDQSQMGRGGMVVNISSVYGIEPGPAFAVYAAAKHGVVGFTRSMAFNRFYLKSGVCFTCVCPGLTSTELMVNLRENITWKHSDELVDLIEGAKQQTPQECAMNIIKVMEKKENGSIFICNFGEIKEVMPKEYWHI